VALRPSLAGGLPFRLLATNRLLCRLGQVKRIRALSLKPTNSQPSCDQICRVAGPNPCLGDLSAPVGFGFGTMCPVRMRGHALAVQNGGDAVVTQPAKVDQGLELTTVAPSDLADGASPSASVAHPLAPLVHHLRILLDVDHLTPPLARVLRARNAMHCT
jgi:hypothetical protein